MARRNLARMSPPPGTPFRSARQLAAGDPRQKKIGCLELLDLYLARVERYDGAINAVVVRDFDRARRRARAADRALAKGEVVGAAPRRADHREGVLRRGGPAHDVGRAEPAGARRGEERARRRPAARRGRRAVRQDQRAAVPRGLAELQRHLRDDQQSRGTSRARPAARRGALRRRSRRGSPALEAGSDIGSSIRNPAHFCGVFGHKPTWGIVPRHGQSLPGQVAPVDIDVVGPLARSADDLTLALSVMAGPDPDRGGGVAASPQTGAAEAPARLQGRADAGRAVDRRGRRRCRTGCEALADFLRREKVKVDDRARPAIDPAEAFRVYVRLLRAATSGAADRCGVRAERGGGARAAARRRQLLRARDAGRRAAAPRLARRQRGAASHAPRMGGLLRALRPPAVPGGRRRRLPPRSDGRAPRAHAARQRPPRAP